MDYSSFTRENMKRPFPMHWNLLNDGEFYRKISFVNEFFMNGATDADIGMLKWFFPKGEFSEEVDL